VGRRMQRRVRGRVCEPWRRTVFALPAQRTLDALVAWCLQLAVLGEVLAWDEMRCDAMRGGEERRYEEMRGDARRYEEMRCDARRCDEMRGDARRGEEMRGAPASPWPEKWRTRGISFSVLIGSSMSLGKRAAVRMCCWLGLSTSGCDRRTTSAASRRASWAHANGVRATASIRQSLGHRSHLLLEIAVVADTMHPPQ
jgi:pentapeptide MXKDX repeat protein